MKPLSAIVVHRSEAPAQILAESLRQHLRFVSTAACYNEACSQVKLHHAQLMILDLETIALNQVRVLLNELPGITIVCTHRSADDRVVDEVLAAGAADCCLESDIRAIVHAAICHTGAGTLADASDSAVA
jgi:DNA-binding NarL/FixJ family response regulator